MPSAVTAFNVKIASPGDEAMELIIAREVIWEWNTLYALEQKQVLLPLYGEEGQACSNCDMLVAFFSKGNVGDQATHGTCVEIEKHLQAGRPALIYFSEARDDFTRTSAVQEQELSDLKKRYESRAAFDSYGDEKEFRAKISRHLEETIATHPYFKTGTLSSSEKIVSAPPVPAIAVVEKKLSECAQTLLIEACEDFEAYIGRVKIGTTLKIQANGKQLVDPSKPDEVAKWDSAFEEILSGGYIRDVGCNGQLYQISTKGFAFLKSIGKTPVGYIAEMGGM